MELKGNGIKSVNICLAGIIFFFCILSIPLPSCADEYEAKLISDPEKAKNYYISSLTTTEKERDDAYKSLREKITKQLSLRKLLLLDGPRLRRLRNEIYARHGYIFKSADMNKYFRNMSWYKPEKNFSEKKLSQTDRDNIELIKKFEYVKTELEFEQNSEDTTGNGWLGSLEKSKKQTNEHIERTKKGIQFNSTGKYYVFLNEQYGEPHIEKIYQDVETFWSTPVIFIRTWRESYVGTESKKLEAYDKDGNLIYINNTPNADIWYDKDKDLFISEEMHGSGGEIKVGMSIFTSKGKTLFFSSDTYFINYIRPLWSKNEFIFIPDSAERMLIFDKNNIFEQPVVKLPHSESYNHRKVVLLEPYVIYWAGRSECCEEKENIEEGLIYLDKEFSDGIKIQYEKPHKFTKEIYKRKIQFARKDSLIKNFTKSERKINKYIKTTDDGIIFIASGKHLLLHKETHQDSGYGAQGQNVYQFDLFEDVETFKNSSLILVRSWAGKVSVKATLYDSSGAFLFSVNVPNQNIWFNDEESLFVSEGSLHNCCGTFPSMSIFDIEGNTLFYGTEFDYDFFVDLL